MSDRADADDAHPDAPGEAPILDVSDWSVVDDEWLGDQEKVWIAAPPDSEHSAHAAWLFKPSRHTELLAPGGASGRTFAWYEAQSELTAHSLARLLRLPSARVFMARRETRTGCISGDVRGAQESLQSGDVFLSDLLGDDYVPNAKKSANRTGHNLRSIGQILDGLEGPAGSDLNASEVFAGYLVLDAWIGNTDRHPDNWALTVHGSSMRLAASFDHGSALAAGRGDEFLGRTDPCEFARGAMAKKFDRGKNVSLVDIAHEALDLWGGPWIERLSAIRAGDERRIVDRAPGLSDLRRMFVGRMLEENRRRLVGS